MAINSWTLCSEINPTEETFYWLTIEDENGERHVSRHLWMKDPIYLGTSPTRYCWANLQGKYTPIAWMHSLQPSTYDGPASWGEVMQTRKDGRKLNTDPLRKILEIVQVPLTDIHGEQLVVNGEPIFQRKEKLECGHIVRIKEDIYGETNAYKRRCSQCGKANA